MSLIKRPVLHGVRLLFGLSAVSMPAALLDLLKHRYLQMAYANNAPQREFGFAIIRGCVRPVTVSTRQIGLFSLQKANYFQHI